MAGRRYHTSPTMAAARPRRPDPRISAGSVGRVPRSLSGRVLLGTLLASALAGCRDGELPAPLAPEPELAQVASAPVVNSLADPGTGGCTDSECTLREAMAFASSGATITFSPGLSGTITLTGGELEVIYKNLTISGPGAENLTVSGSTSRVFFVFSGNLTLRGLTITGGTGTGWYGPVQNRGGGIVVYGGSHLSLEQSVVSGNTATNEGGGISSWNSTVQVTESRIAENASGSFGGGIYATRSVDAQGSLVIDRSSSSRSRAPRRGGCSVSS